jgi:predicted DNA-binding transcriptional regulator YafY
MVDTTQRVLSLLNLLQSRPVWSGPELAERLGVTTRCIRRDITRLRELGYPVNATHGTGGGYRLGRGRALPPLLLDDAEAVAVAVCLRLAAGGTVAGADEATLRALAKLDQVMPAPLRAKVKAVHESTDTLLGASEVVDPDILLALATACRAHQRVRFSYARVRPGDDLGGRYVEPYRMVATGRRWYLMAYDLDRDDWRTFRLDRITAAAGTGWVFTPRRAPEAMDFVRRSISRSGYPHVARVLVRAPLEQVRAGFNPTWVTLSEHSDGTLLTTGAERLTWLAFWLTTIPYEITVLDPPELVAEILRLVETLRRTV